MRKIWLSLGLLILLVACGPSTADKDSNKPSSSDEILSTGSTKISSDQMDVAVLITEITLLTERLEELESKSSPEELWDYRSGFSVRLWNAERFGEPATGSLEEAVRAIHNRLDALEKR